MQLRGWVFGIASLFCHCRPTVGDFTPTAYRHPSLEYGVVYADKGSQSLMPDAWQLDNMYSTDGGWKAKTGADYVSTLHLDTDGDGETNDLGESQTFDLRFVHKTRASVIALRTFPIRPASKDIELRVRVEALAANLAGGENRVVQLEGELRVTTSDDRYATRIVRRADGKLAGKDAHAARIDIVNVDQLKIDPDHVETRLEVVIARTGLTFRASGEDFPVLMLATYASSPGDFERDLDDFDDLLSRVELDGKRGFKLDRGDTTNDKPDASAPDQKPDVEPEPTPALADAGVD